MLVLVFVIQNRWRGVDRVKVARRRNRSAAQEDVRCADRGAHTRYKGGGCMDGMVLKKNENWEAWG